MSRAIATQFIERFCAADIDGIETLLSPSLKFRGPFFQFDKRQDYIDSLRRDPPQPSRYEILGVTDNEKEVALFYDYIKPDGKITIAQLFKFDEHQKINEMLLIFNGRV